VGCKLHHELGAAPQPPDVLVAALPLRPGDLADLVAVETRQAGLRGDTIEGAPEARPGRGGAEVEEAVAHVTSVDEVNWQVQVVDVPLKAALVELLDQHSPRVLVGDVPQHHSGVRVVILVILFDLGRPRSSGPSW